MTPGGDTNEGSELLLLTVRLLIVSLAEASPLTLLGVNTLVSERDPVYSSLYQSSGEGKLSDDIPNQINDCVNNKMFNLGQC